MQKLGVNVLNKIIENKCTSREIDFLLYISQYQNNLGKVESINQRETCNELGISKQTFYNILSSLERKNIIKVDYSNKKDWDIVILDNMYFLPYQKLRRYINTNRVFLFSNEFRAQKTNVKLLVLRLIERTFKNSFKISLIKLQEMLNVASTSLVMEYIRAISDNGWFKVTFVKSRGRVIVIFTPLVTIAVQSAFEEEKYFIHRLATWCLQKKIGFTLKDLKDVYKLYCRSKQYIGKFIGALVDTSLKYGILQPPLINYAISFN